jgi:hypothetical protein
LLDPTAAQSVVVAQEIPYSPATLLGTDWDDQVAPPSVVPRTMGRSPLTVPVTPTATQVDVDGHEMDVSRVLPGSMN